MTDIADLVELNKSNTHLSDKEKWILSAILSLRSMRMCDNIAEATVNKFIPLYSIPQETDRAVMDAFRNREDQIKYLDDLYKSIARDMGISLKRYDQLKDMAYDVDVGRGDR